jgi:threonine/homoserine/homoserine lactone efflux protein
MQFVPFLAQVVLISLSGVMAPGPMTAVTLGKGSRSPHAGALISMGHGIVEVPVMMLLLFGMGSFLQFGHVRVGLGLVGGVVLGYLGVGMFRSMNVGQVAGQETGRSPLLAGIVMSAGNPYFLIWWATIGITLIMQSAQYGPLGVAAFAVVHWLCDLVWLWFLSAMSYKGGRFFGRKFQKVVFAICGAVLLGFSVKFIGDALLRTGLLT